MDEDDYYLKWEKHHNAFVSSFDYLYKHGILVDCTLSAEEKYIKAHRIVLMACSPYLQNLLCEHSDNYPVLYFDIKYSELQAIVNYCYRGEVKIPFNELEGLLEAAAVLQIKGLCKVSDSDSISDTNSETSKRRLSLSDSNSVENMCKKSKIVSSFIDGDNGLTKDGEPVEDDVGDDVADRRNGPSPHPLSLVSVKSQDLLSLGRDMQGSDNSDVDSDDTGGSSDGEGDDQNIDDIFKASSTLLFPWTCNRCGEAFASRSAYGEHRRNCPKVDPISHPWKCDKCTNAYKNRKDLQRHLIYCGNLIPRLYCNRCGNSYKYERGLKRHQKYCGTNVQPLKCPQCEKTYKYKRGLRKHQRRCGIAEALQFLAGKGVTPVVVTKRSLNLHGLGVLANSGLPLTSHLNSVKALENSESNAQLSITDTSDNASVCLCGKVYKYKKSYDKHIASCACGQSQSADSVNKEKGTDNGEEVEQVEDGGRQDTHDEHQQVNGSNQMLELLSKSIINLDNIQSDGNQDEEEEEEEERNDVNKKLVEDVVINQEEEEEETKSEKNDKGVRLEYMARKHDDVVINEHKQDQQQQQQEKLDNNGIEADDLMEPVEEEEENNKEELVDYKQHDSCNETVPQINSAA